MPANSDVSDSHGDFYFALTNHLVAVSRSLHCSSTVYSIQRVVIMAGRVTSRANRGAARERSGYRGAASTTAR